MSELILPGLIDVHTHLRVPGGEHKEDFYTGTSAALAGGITMVLGMPNTSPALTTVEAMEVAHAQMAKDAVCDVGVYAAASADDIELLPTLAPYASPLKIYLNDTFGKLRMDEVPAIMRAFELWPKGKMIGLHAEKQSVAVAIGMAATYNRPVHICHVSRKEEIELIAAAKAQGIPVTCEVAPHHLFMDTRDYEKMGVYADMRPILGTPDDVAALWDHINTTVDMIATDHAPHTLAEKQSDNPPPGISGLETSLPLMMTAVMEGKLKHERLVELMYYNPRLIFDLPEQEETYIVVSTDKAYTITNEALKTKCGWTPFAGKEVVGKVKKVVIRNTPVYEDGKVLVEGGFGQIIR